VDLDVRQIPRSIERISSFHIYILTKFGDKVYIFLLNSYINFMQKFARIAKISTEIRGGYFLRLPGMRIYGR